MCKVTSIVEATNWVNIIATLYSNRALNIHSRMENESYNLTPIQYLPFNETVTKLISTRKEITVTDASIR